MTGTIEAPPAKPDEKTLADAYTYLLGRVLVIRQEHMDRRGDGFAFNTIKYNPLGSADFVNPNFDVVYLEAWLVVDDRTPVLLEIPEIKERYYTAQILDEWGEVIVNINERTFPSKPYGGFALVKPGFAGSIPVDAARIELHSSKAKLLGRVEIKGPNFSHSVAASAEAVAMKFDIKTRISRTCVSCWTRDKVFRDEFHGRTEI